MKWFKELMKKYSFANSTFKMTSDNFNYEVSDSINNKNLISSEFIIYQNSNSSQEGVQRYFTGKVLKADLKLNIDYTVVGHRMFEYITNKLGYKCNNIICR